MSNLNNIIGNNVRTKREQQNMTGEELAKKSGVSTSMIYYIESGRKKPSVLTLIALADSLLCTVDDLVH